MSEYKGDTDKCNKIKLVSSIDRVLWNVIIAAVGAKVRLEIFTHFVGNNSELEIELTDKSGKKHGKFKEKISGNKFWADISVPEDAKEELYAEVKLPKHGLKMKSNPLYILPPVKIENVKWDKTEARRGDILSLTADIYTVPDGTEAEIEIWEYDDDQAHDLITKFPVLIKDKKVEAKWEFEYHEDTDDIVRKEESELGYNPPEYFFIVRVDGNESKSELLEFKDWIEIELVDEDNRRIPNADYKLHLPDGTVREGNLDAEGFAKEEDLPPGNIIIVFPNN